MSNHEETAGAVPMYWDKLSLQDQKEYEIMKEMLSSSKCKNRRNKSAETFQDVINTIKIYVMRGDDSDINRGIVCGLFWCGDDLAINTRQLRLLLGRCKSSINGSLQMIGYTSPSSNSDQSSKLMTIFPQWKERFQEMRQWTLRHKPKEEIQTTHSLSEKYIQKTTSLLGKLSMLQPQTINYESAPPDFHNDDDNGCGITIETSETLDTSFADDITFEYSPEDQLDFNKDSFTMWDNFSEDPTLNFDDQI